MALENNPDYRDGYNKGGGYGSRAYNEGVTARAADDRRKRAQWESVTPSTPSFPIPAGRGAGGSTGNASSLTLLATFAAAWFVVWPWLGQVGFTQKLAGMVQGANMDLQSAVLLAIVIQFFMLLALCSFVALRLRWIGLLGAAALLYLHFRQ
jgi:hypothetical protein